VRSFAEALQKDGIDVMLDQWHALPGDQLTAFMDRAIRENSFVLIICTPKYKSKSDTNQGGVGYEGYVIQGEMFITGNHRKFIPILRSGEWNLSAPSTLLGKYYINLRDKSTYEANYQLLLSTLLGKPSVDHTTSPNRSEASIEETSTPRTDPKKKKEGRTNTKKATPSPRNYKMFMFLGFGVLVLLIFFAVFFKECPTNAQLQIFHIILALGVAGLAASLPGFITIRYKGFISAGGALAVFIIVFLVEPAKLAKARSCIESFSVIAHLEKRNGDISPFINQKFGLLIGNHRIDPKEVNTNGEVIFDNIPAQYLTDTIKLKPVNPRMRVVSQSVWVPNQSTSAAEMTFLIEIDQDSTLVKGKVFSWEENRMVPVVSAVLIFNNEFKAETNSTGNYTVALPLQEGATCEIQIMHKGIIIFNERTLISSKVPLDFPIRAIN
jgi:hypothetical protein